MITTALVVFGIVFLVSIPWTVGVAAFISGAKGAGMRPSALPFFYAIWGSTFLGVIATAIVMGVVLVLATGVFLINSLAGILT